MMGTFKKIVTKSLVILVFGIPLQASAEVFNLPAIGDDLIGAITVVTARAEDTLLDIARRHGWLKQSWIYRLYHNSSQIDVSCKYPSTTPFIRTIMYYILYCISRIMYVLH